MACFGIWSNTIGLHPASYSKHYAFDQIWLSGRVNLIVVVLGLFALSQAFILLQGDDENITLKKMKGSFFQSFRELARHPRIAGASATFGVIMGMIPGIGEFTAQFMSYTYAAKTSKRPEDFGHGSSEGLIAAETANNAVSAAAMVPLLALGLPGEALTAMMLRVFYVHNVTPGPQLFQNDMDFVAALYLALLLLNVLVLHIRRVWLDAKERKAKEWSTNHASTSFATSLSRRKDFLLTERGKKVRERRSTFSRRSTGTTDHHRAGNGTGRGRRCCGGPARV